MAIKKAAVFFSYEEHSRSKVTRQGALFYFRMYEKEAIPFGTTSDLFMLYMI
jgi:hypothetical protein